MEYGRSSQFQRKKFVNLNPTPSMAYNGKNIMSLIRDYMKPNPNRRPRSKIPMMKGNVQLDPVDRETTVTWFGHSASMVQIEGKTLLLDPMFGDAPSPFPAIGGKRYSGHLPIEIHDLPVIDAVLFSHDHYDHLDYGTVKQIKDKVKQFYVPLGVGSHLIRWGVHPDLIHELDWWEETELNGLRLVCTPARHFSGRSITDSNATLWCSWVIQGQESKIFFSGDSGYDTHFKTIGHQYGPFDLTLMECGQYDERWHAIHMMPEQTVQAHQDVKGGTMIPIHWGAFTLALHDWTDSIERVTSYGQEMGVSIATPQMGEPVIVGSSKIPNQAWWKL
ncbi:hypothetical protein BVG16_22200 [Paenibacillus selenitireducens]|uniref:Metallo-beta-lactamase domain-containing protein n=1 Tax=Paenibacillus selenitireducens TaxID=1324314 RepID=A0A1T2X6B9_9BACL|nr:MBL fold metallo-hydrolase [Paenibacillus selenitireducens]OPA75390.1 hypothetical protein BVG16_22200 [Paenibacillus selenitireducens]